VGVHGIFISAIRKSAFVMLSVIADVKNLFSFYIYLMLFLCISIACFILCFHLLYTDLFSVSSLCSHLRAFLLVLCRSPSCWSLPPRVAGCVFGEICSVSRYDIIFMSPSLFHEVSSTDLPFLFDKEILQYYSFGYMLLDFSYGRSGLC
jgi:hypothetical protein